MFDGLRIKEQTQSRHMFEIDWTMFSYIVNYYTLNKGTQLGGSMYATKASTNMHFS